MSKSVINSNSKLNHYNISQFSLKCMAFSAWRKMKTSEKNQKKKKEEEQLNNTSFIYS